MRAYSWMCNARVCVGLGWLTRQQNLGRSLTIPRNVNIAASNKDA